LNDPLNLVDPLGLCGESHATGETNPPQPCITLPADCAGPPIPVPEWSQSGDTFAMTCPSSTDPGMANGNIRPPMPQKKKPHNKFFFPPHVCVGTARVLGGNPQTVNQPGAVPSINVAAGSAAAIPSQFGVSKNILLGSPISGTVGYFGPLNPPSAGTSQSFNGITDVTGGRSPIPGLPVREALQRLNPGELILELVTGKDMNSVPVQ